MSSSEQATSGAHLTSLPWRRPTLLARDNFTMRNSTNGGNFISFLADLHGILWNNADDRNCSRRSRPVFSLQICHTMMQFSNITTAAIQALDDSSLTQTNRRSCNRGVPESPVEIEQSSHVSGEIWTAHEKQLVAIG